MFSLTMQIWLRSWHKYFILHILVSQVITETYFITFITEFAMIDTKHFSTAYVVIYKSIT